MIIHDAVDTAELIIGGALLWAGAAGAAAGVVALAVLAAGFPLGVWASARRPQRRRADRQLQALIRHHTRKANQ